MTRFSRGGGGGGGGCLNTRAESCTHQRCPAVSYLVKARLVFCFFPLCVPTSRVTLLTRSHGARKTLQHWPPNLLRSHDNGANTVKILGYSPHLSASFTTGDACFWGEGGHLFSVPLSLSVHQRCGECYASRGAQVLAALQADTCSLRGLKWLCSEKSWLCKSVMVLSLDLAGMCGTHNVPVQEQGPALLVVPSASSSLAASSVSKSTMFFGQGHVQELHL